MLVLSRKIGEKVLLGSEIEITVINISGNRVYLRINAPMRINIRRSELEDRKITSDDGTLRSLVLSRKRHEAVLFDNDTTIVVQKIQTNRVSIGINAPRGIQITRPEVCDKTA